jgi:nicotinamidase-related amidase
MPAKNEDLHGSAPDKCETALLLIDVINDLAFPEAEQMLPDARVMARKLLALKQRAREAGVPSIEHCLSQDSRGREIVETLRPDDDDYFVLKPKHSGFFSTTLETLLHYVGARRLILTGIAGNFCVLFTANDAYMRDFNLLIPEDCCVSNTPRENEEALGLMRKFLKADTRPSGEIVLDPEAK